MMLPSKTVKCDDALNYSGNTPGNVAAEKRSEGFVLPAQHTDTHSADDISSSTQGTST